MSDNKLSRRKFLGTAAASGVGLMGLAACSGGTQSGGNAPASAAHAGASNAAPAASVAASTAAKYSLIILMTRSASLGGKYIIALAGEYQEFDGSSCFGKILKRL